MLMYAQNRITVPRGIVDGQPAAHSGAAVRAILDHFQQAWLIEDGTSRHDLQPRAR